MPESYKYRHEFYVFTWHQECFHWQWSWTLPVRTLLRIFQTFVESWKFVCLFFKLKWTHISWQKHYLVKDHYANHNKVSNCMLHETFTIRELYTFIKLFTISINLWRKIWHIILPSIWNLLSCGYFSKGLSYAIFQSGILLLPMHYLLIGWGNAVHLSVPNTYLLLSLTEQIFCRPTKKGSFVETDINTS